MDLTPSIPTAQGIFFILFFPYFSFTPPHESELTLCSIGRRRFFFFFHPRKKKEKTQNRRPVHRSSTVFFCFFFFYYFLSRHLVAQSIPTAQMVLDHSSSFFFFFSCHLMAQSRHTAQSVLDHFPSLFFFFTPPRGSEQTRCSIGPRPFIPLLRHLVAQSRHAAQSLLTIFFNNYPLLFTFDATSWLRTETNPPRPSQGASKKKGVNGIANFSRPEQKIRNSSQILQTLIHKYKREQQQKKHNIKQQPIPQHLRNRTAASPKE